MQHHVVLSCSTSFRRETYRFSRDSPSYGVPHSQIMVVECQAPREVSNVERLLIARHTTRVFTEKVPPTEIVNEALQIAQRSPSSTNIQPWRVAIATGAALSRLRTALVANFDRGAALELADLPQSHHHYRQQLGKEIYGPDGYDIPHTDSAGRMKSIRHNFEFYDAPMVAFIGIDAALNDADILSVGMYLQTLILLLTERGLSTGVSAATAGYPRVIREKLGIPENVKLLCTLHIGYEDDTTQINKLKMSRRDHLESTRFV